MIQHQCYSSFIDIENPTTEFHGRLCLSPSWWCPHLSNCIKFTDDTRLAWGDFALDVTLFTARDVQCRFLIRFGFGFSSIFEKLGFVLE